MLFHFTTIFWPLSFHVNTKNQFCLHFKHWKFSNQIIVCQTFSNYWISRKYQEFSFIHFIYHLSKYTHKHLRKLTQIRHAESFRHTSKFTMIKIYSTFHYHLNLHLYAHTFIAYPMHIQYQTKVWKQPQNRICKINTHPRKRNSRVLSILVLSS